MPPNGHRTTNAMRRLEISFLLLLIQLYQSMMEILTEILLNDDVESTMSVCRLLAVELETIENDQVAPLRIQNYVERIVPGLTASQFQAHFRMTPDIFNIVLHEFAPLIMSANKFTPITKTMDPQKQFLAVLWLLATPDSYRSVAERFDMGKSSLHKSFTNIVKVLNSQSRRLIKWPWGQEETVSRKFQRIAGLPLVIGAVDGSYIAIKAPQEFPERYINRKCHHAITMQGICDADLKFTDVFVGYPSSVSDRRIFTNSDIYKNITTRRPIPQNYYIIGDKAYPVLRWCIPPFIERGELSTREREFNSALAKTRQCIERAFALLKGRFRRLKYLDMSMTEFIPAVILSCCVLHNICLYNKEMDENLEQFIVEGLPDVEGEGSNEMVEEGETDGRNFREDLINLMNRGPM